MDKLGDFKGEVVHSGMHPGLPAQQGVLWERGNNVVFADQSVKVAPTQSPLFTKLSSLPGNGILAANNLGSPALVWGTRTRLYRGLTQPTAVNVTRYTATPGDDDYTGGDSDLWSFAQLGNSVLATNGVDKVQYLANLVTSNNFVNIDTVSDLAASFRCKIVRKTGAFVVAYNTDNISTEYRWCDEDDWLTWGPDALNKARDQNIRELASDIICVVELGRTHIVYGHDQLFIVAFTGAPFYFTHQHLLNGVGAVGKQSVVSVGRRNFGFGPNGIFILDGASYQYVDTPSIHRHIYEENFDAARGEEVIAWADPNEEIAYFSYPTLDGGGATVGLNWRTGGWALFDWYRTSASPGGIWKYPVMVDNVGQTWGQGATSTPFAIAGRPIGIYDEMELESYYGHLGYGEGGYGGTWAGVD